MITRFLTEVRTSFNPFSPRAKVPRNFLASLPSKARTDMKIDVRLLPRGAGDACTLALKFKDGKTMDVDVGKLGLKEIMQEVNRHSRQLGRQEELTGG